MALPNIKNSVGMAVTAVADSGEGTLTVGSALSGGYQTAATAYGADANIDIRVEEGNNWEVCRDCAYDHSELTVTRGTQEDGSSGPSTRVAFTTAAKVYVVESAERMRRTVGGYLEHAAHDGSAAVTGVVGTLHVFTGLTADRAFTLPASAQAGDRIGVTFPAGSASYEILLKSASGDKINDVNCSSTEWSRLFIAGETVIFRCVDASTVDWIVEYDGRIPCVSRIFGSFTHTSTSAAQYADYSSATVIDSVGWLEDIANDRVTVRRASAYAYSVRGSMTPSASAKYLKAAIHRNDIETLSFQIHSSSSAGLSDTVYDSRNCAVGDYFQIGFTQTDSTSESISFAFSLIEVL